MPMIDVYASEGTFSDTRKLAQDLASAVMRWEQVPNLALFRDNTVAFIHEMPSTAICTVAGRNDYIRVQVLTPVGALDRDKQLAVVSQFTELITAATADTSMSNRTWVLLTEAVDGGWGLAGHAHTNAELVDAARAEIAELSSK